MVFRAIIWVLFIIIGGCSSIQVKNDYDPGFDFSRLKTFAILYNQSKAGNSLNQERISKAIKRELDIKGYKETEKKYADFYVVFHTNVTNKTQIVTDYKRVGLYPYRYWASPRIPVQRQYSYKEGKIIIDALSPKTKQIFWRGIATDRLQSFKSPEERIEYINRVINEVLKSFPPAKGLS